MELPSLLASQCLQISIPDWLSVGWDWIECLVLWMTFAKPDDDRTLLSVIFALNAGFASIDYFTQSILRSLRHKLSKEISKYKDREWSNKIGSEDTVVNLKRREAMSQLADAALRIQNKIPGLFNSQAKKWKTWMAIAAAVSLVCMVIPFTGRITILLALPVPLFALRCNLKKSDIEKECKDIDVQYEKLIKCEDESSKPVKQDETVSRLDKIEVAVNNLIAQLQQGNNKRKNGQKRKNNSGSSKTTLETNNRCPS